MKSGDRVWVNFPSKEYIDKDGAKKYAPYVRFTEAAHMKEFSSQARKAIELYCSQQPPQEEE